jgi:hypothetical protein
MNYSRASLIYLPYTQIIAVTNQLSCSVKKLEAPSCIPITIHTVDGWNKNQTPLVSLYGDDIHQIPSKILRLYSNWPLLIVDVHSYPMYSHWTHHVPPCFMLNPPFPPFSWFNLPCFTIFQGQTHIFLYLMIANPTIWWLVIVNFPNPTICSCLNYVKLPIFTRFCPICLWLS